MVKARVLDANERSSVLTNVGAAQSLAQTMPQLALDAQRISASAAAGIHGRRRVGQGTSFWQYREHGAGEAATRIDWRRSARDTQLYVREREWEAATSMWLWVDRSPSMAFMSKFAKHSKLEHAVVITLALADMLVRGGERTGLHGLTPPQASRKIIERLGEALVLDERSETQSDMPHSKPIGGREEIILVGDFITDLDSIKQNIAALAAQGGRGHLILIRDPVEDIFPFSGETEFEDVQGGVRMHIGDAAGFATKYKNRISAHTQGVQMIAESYGWTLTQHSTDRPASEPVFALMTLLREA